MDTLTIYQTDKYRILEKIDYDYDLQDLKGDIYDPECIKEFWPNKTPHELRLEEIIFETKVSREGVYGYELERLEADGTWSHLDSCWGFVGRYNSENNKHEFIQELINLALSDAIETELKEPKTNTEVGYL